MGLLRRALAVRRLGKDTMQQILRMPPMSVRDFLNEWFETDLLKASIAVDALVGTFQGPFSPGTAFGLVPHFLPAVQGGGWSFVKGGMGTLASALALAAREAGATIRTNADVRRITSTDGRVTGVELSNGERIVGRAVASNADPKRTFLHLIDPEELGPEFLVHVRNFEMNGVVAKVNFALDRAPPFAGASGTVPAHFRICPSLEYLERAYEDAKYGSVSVAPFLDVFVPSVEGLYLCGSGAHPGGGVTGAPGYNAAREILADWNRISS